ncbi:hypothetical protein FCV43_19335 [Vibrio genomosp. F6]|uniref:hypothetical protein n=1 Tax=Vibrio genomosp. F6 TaxID=723172 RepID=UPI0010BD6242|nr:hypothetical protein [Vibrio genomosp. F6]TKF14859.1 hypothetical protein FCV43_19335 [Vibrio genomosp. F6]
MEETVKVFRGKIDSDSGYVSKRRGLILLSMIMLAFTFTGAKLTEVNTLIFKFTLDHQTGLLELMVLAQLYYFARYYSYAFPYQSELAELWKSRLMTDYKVFNFDEASQEVSGLVAKKMNLFGGDFPECRGTKYEVSGLFQRNVYFESYMIGSEGEHEPYVEVYRLNQFDEFWTRKHFWALLRVETRYRFSALFQYRENLDILGPYFIGFIALYITLTNSNLDFSRFLELLL